MKIRKVIKIMILCTIIIFSMMIGKVSATDTNLELGSPSAILIESKTGRVLYEKEPDKVMYPASTTKIMTAILTLENVIDLQEKVTVSYNAVFTVPSGYSTDLLKVGEELTVEELLYALLVKSSNEAANVLAEHVAGSVDSFATMMNTKAAELGCKNTHFVNPNGVHHKDHYSSASDLAVIAREAMKNEVFRKIVATASHTLPSTNKYERTDRNLITTNDLIRKASKYYYDYAIGIKTGYTSQAKNCLVAGANKDGVELIAVVLGAEKLNSNRQSTRDLDAKNLFDYVYENFSEKQVIAKDGNVKTIEVKNATKDTKELNLLAENEITSLVTNDKLKQEEEANVVLKEEIKAPIAKGTVLGTVSYTIDGIQYTSNLVAEHDVEKSNVIPILFGIVGIIIILYLLNKIMGKKKKKKSKRSKGKYVKTIR